MFRGVFRRFFWPAAASVHLSHIFPRQNPFSGRFAVFRAFCVLLPAMPVRASLLRLLRYFGQQISSARKLCLQSRAQQRQTWLNFLRPVVGSIKKLQYSLSLLDILGMVSPPFFFWLQHIDTDFPCVLLRLSIRFVPCPGVSPRRCSARQSGCFFAESYHRPMSGIQLSRCGGHLKSPLNCWSTGSLKICAFSAKTRILLFFPSIPNLSEASQ